MESDMEGNIMHMSVRTWWVNHYEEHGKVKKSGDCIDVYISQK